MFDVIEARTARAAARLYSGLVYVATLGAFAGLFCFLLGFGLPRTIDEGPVGSAVLAVFVDLGLIAAFALQHTVMARPSFKRWWTRFVPKPIERSTYMLLTLLALAVLYWLWRPIPQVVWQLPAPLAWLGYAFHGVGWAVFVASLFLLDHLELAGLRQTWLRGRGGKSQLETPSLYKIVRHPMMLGWIIIFWATPRMTMGHLLFAAAMTVYIVIALHFEERNLVDAFGSQYVQYQREVPKLLPRLTRGSPRVARRDGAGQDRSRRLVH